MHHVDFHLCWPASKGRAYRKLAFQVPEGAEYLHLKGSYQGDGRIDVGLIDPAGKIRGWTSPLSKEVKVLIGEEQASLGYQAGSITSGEWQLLLGNNKAHEDDLDIEVQISLEPYRQRFVCGDIHGHSLHSDGEHSVEEKLRMAKEAQLDFLGFTDHNSVSQNRQLLWDRDVLLLPSVEITTYNGHVNLFNYQKPEIPNFAIEDPEEMRKLLVEIKESGASIQVNHPIRIGDCSGCQWGWGYEGMPFDWMEVWNGLWDESCQANLDLWHSFLCKGKFLPLSGNSDFHRLRNTVKRQGSPCNNVLVGRKTQAEIIKQLAAGNNYVSYAPKMIALSIHGPNDELIPLGSNSPFPNIELRLHGPLDGCLLRCICDQDSSEQELQIKSGHHYSLAFNGKGRRFLRWEIWQGAEPLLLSNPVFFQ